MSYWTTRPSGGTIGGNSMNSRCYRRPAPTTTETSCTRQCLRCKDWKILLYVLMGSALAVITVIAVMLTIFFLGGSVGRRPTKESGHHTSLPNIHQITDDNLFFPLDVTRPLLENHSSSTATPEATRSPDHVHLEGQQDFSAFGEAEPIPEASDDNVHGASTQMKDTGEASTTSVPSKVIDYASGTAARPLLQGDVVGSMPSQNDHAGDNIPPPPLGTTESAAPREHLTNQSVPSTLVNQTSGLTANDYESSSAVLPPPTDDTGLGHVPQFESEESQLPSFENIPMDNTGWSPLPDDTFYAWLASAGSRYNRKTPSTWSSPLPPAVTDAHSSGPELSGDDRGVEKTTGIYTGAEVLGKHKTNVPYDPSSIKLADDILSEFLEDTTTTSSIAIENAMAGGEFDHYDADNDQVMSAAILEAGHFEDSTIIEVSEILHSFDDEPLLQEETTTSTGQSSTMQTDTGKQRPIGVGSAQEIALSNDNLFGVTTMSQHVGGRENTRRLI